MVNDDPETYSSTALCEAVGLRRTTLDAWVLRRYLDLSAGPGTGRERRFSADEAVLVAVAAELTRLGLTVTVAAHATNALSRSAANGQTFPVQHEAGWMLITAPSLAPAGIDAPTLFPVALIKPKTLAALRRFIREKQGDPAAVVIADVSAIARRTIGRLKDSAPMTKARHPKS